MYKILKEEVKSLYKNNQDAPGIHKEMNYEIIDQIF